jgi:hypothetical protein
MFSQEDSFHRRSKSSIRASMGIRARACELPATLRLWVEGDIADNRLPPFRSIDHE